MANTHQKRGNHTCLSVVRSGKYDVGFLHTRMARFVAEFREYIVSAYTFRCRWYCALHERESLRTSWKSHASSMASSNSTHAKAPCLSATGLHGSRRVCGVREELD
jgi:hypothetical protein